MYEHPMWKGSKPCAECGLPVLPKTSCRCARKPLTLRQMQEAKRAAVRAHPDVVALRERRGE